MSRISKNPNFFTGKQLKDGQMIPLFKKYLRKELKEGMAKKSNGVSGEREYEFPHKVRGIAIVISNEIFKSAEPRKYADIELRKMNETFEGLGYIVMLFKDLTAEQMYEVISTATCKEMDFFLEKSDSFACVLASHGNEVQEDSPADPKVKVYHHVIHGTNGGIRTHLLLDLLDENRCNKLQGKPKLFFVQACRSRFGQNPSRFDGGVVPPSKRLRPNPGQTGGTATEDCKEDEDEVTTVKTPCHNDFLIMYSTSEGKAGFGREEMGGWLLHVMNKIMSEHIQFIREDPQNCLDFLSVMTHVMHEIGVDFETDTGNPLTSGLKTAPTLQHKLSKDLIFRNKYIS